MMQPNGSVTVLPGKRSHCPGSLNATPLMQPDVAGVDEHTATTYAVANWERPIMAALVGGAVRVMLIQANACRYDAASRLVEDP